MKTIVLRLVILVSTTLIFFNCTTKKHTEINSSISIVPLPKEIKLSEDLLTLKEGFKVVSSKNELEKLQEVFNEFQLNKESENVIDVLPSITSNLNKESYELEIFSDKIEIRGGSYRALVFATVTLLQMSQGVQTIPLGIIKDKPEYGYRGVMLDLSRNWHDITSIKQVISLASWYKLNYVQLHLTDDALFTFQSKAFPKLASNKSYSAEELEDLNAFAKTRGITLIPEIDVPGHSSGFIRAMPKLFGLKNVRSNSYTLNMGKEEVYKALDVLFGEVAAAFPDAPYIHLGGDEVFTAGFLEDPDVQDYLEKHHLEDVHELYRHFLVRIADIIKSKGKKPVLWSGFEKEGKVEIPKDITIMYWNPTGYFPQDMLNDGYEIINASWQPLYVVNNRKWSTETIYKWTPENWRGSETPLENPALKAKRSEGLMGASMSVWEQNQFKVFSSLEERLPAMAEKLWSTKSTGYSNFKERINITKKGIKNAVFPFEIKEEGLMFPKDQEPNFTDDMWFQDVLKISLESIDPSIALYYTLDGSEPTMTSEKYSTSLSINKPTRFSVKAFQNGKAIGQTRLKSYRLMPVRFEVSGLANDLQPRSWERHKFIDSIQVRLHTERKGEIRYTTDNSVPTKESLLYEKPFSIKSSGLLRAKLFDKEGSQVGSERWEEYEVLQQETSLTTGKKVTTSNAYEAGVPGIVTDGKITRWDHWGAHTDGNNWVIVDLEKEQEINAFKVYTFWDNYRYYEYTIEVSSDQKTWKMVVDQSKNRQLSTPNGQLDSIQPIKARYLKLNLIRNSANPGLHLVEFHAF